jgi:urease accessory protein UreE
LDVLLIVLYDRVVRNWLKNLKVDVGSTTATVDIEMTLVRGHEDTLPVQHLWLGQRLS